MSESPTKNEDAGAVGGPGLLEADGQKARIVFRRSIRHPIQEVWNAITEPEQVEAWAMVKLSREDTAGGQIVMEYPNHIRATGRVLEWLPPRSYEYEWNLPPGPSQPEGEASIVRWDLTPTEGGTLLVLTHRRLTRPTATVFSRGLRVFLDRLVAHLDGAPMPEPPWLSQPH
jgi:uncharacterized protein YndB with AHSA1/START domain